MKWPWALAVYGCFNCVLYVSLLPLWDGFDEPFHYGYVQELSHHACLPVFGKLSLSREICDSLALSPQSPPVKANLPWVATLDAAFQETPAERVRRLDALDRLRPDGAPGGCSLNYEAHQAPLAYAVLAPLDRLLSPFTLRRRIWCLRLICALAALAGTLVSIYKLVNRLDIPPLAANAIVFVVLSSQMFYATVAHVANDWLAVPLMTLLAERILAVYRRPGVKRFLLVGVVFSLGLLTKSYLLSFIPVIAFLCALLVYQRRASYRAAGLCWTVILAVAGPWYLRNLLTYHNVSGMQETMKGVSLAAIAGETVKVEWLPTVLSFVRATMWTGNNSFSSFSQITLSLLLTGYAAGIARLICRFLKRERHAEDGLMMFFCIGYAAALAYSAVVTALYTDGRSAVPSPWYALPAVPVVLCLIFNGARYRVWRGCMAAWMTAISSYILCATYWAKLIPFYSGYTGERMTIPGMIRHYADPAKTAAALAGTSLQLPSLIMPLAFAETILSVVLAVVLIVRLGHDSF